MKPSIERELEEIRKALRELEARLKNEREQLGHREVFSIGRHGEVPAPSTDDRDNNRVLGTTGWIAQTGGGGGSGTPDGHTLASVTGVLNAEPLSGSVDGHFNALSGTVDAHFINLSGTIDVKFVTISGSIDSRLTNVSSSVDVLSGSVDGHFNALSGTINSALAAMFSGSQVWSQTANGSEGSILTAVLPSPYPNTSYYAFITDSTGSTSPVYRIRNKSSSSFQVVSTAPFASGDKIDFLAITGGLGPVWDGSILANLSGTIDAHFINLSGTVDGHFNQLSGTVDAHFINLSGTIDSHFNNLGNLVPTIRALTGSSPVRIDGLASANLSTDRTISLVYTSTVIGTPSIDVAGWAASTNLTTEGTIDWTAWDANGTQGGYSWPVIQARPPSASPRAFRLYNSLSWNANGSATPANIGGAAAYTGNGISTTVGDNNYSATALSNASTSPAYTQNANNGGMTIKFRVFPNESAFTLKLYLVVVDSVHSYTMQVIEDGVSVQTLTGTLTSINGSTVLTRISMSLTPGSQHDSWFQFTTRRTSTPTNVNPRIYAVGATMF